MRVPSRTLSRFAVPILVLAVVGCAQGGGGGRGTNRLDSSIGDGGVADSSRRDSGARDSGAGDSGLRDSAAGDTGLRDSGRPDAGSTCVDDAIPDDCEGATELGMLDVGGTLTVMGKLPTLVDEDWYAVDVPAGFVDPLMAGGGAPRVTLDSGDATMVMEIRMRCSAALACNESTARELLEWSFVDDQSDEGDGAYSTRDVAWPERVMIKVSRRGGPATCEDYTLNLTR